MPKRYAISVVLPSFNEEANFEETVGKCLAALRRLSDRPEVVIVDDGSSDGMPRMADALAAREPAVKVIHNPINLGAGISLLVGMSAASGDLIAHDSMDYPFDLNDLEKALPLFDDHDVVVMVRTDRAAHSNYRKITSWVHHKLVRLLFGTRLRDMNFVQVYRRDAVRRLTIKAKSPAFVTPEILIRAQAAGLRVAEMDAVFHPRKKGVASYGKPRDILWTLADMLAFWMERRTGRAGKEGA